jgi:uncharacterized membrane protein
MRARLAWLAGAAGVAGAVLYRRLGREGASAGDPRAAELFESAETPVDAAGEARPEARRQVVHDRGRAAAEEMRGRTERA